MRSNKSFNQTVSPEVVDASANSIQYDISRLYPRIKTNDLLIYVLQRMCDSVIRANSPLRVIGFVVSESVMSQAI